MTAIDTDALVIGAGPAGLFGVFELGLREIGAHVIDALPFAGGQCVELYADKPLYDIPALPVCTGRELTERLLAQIRPFAAPLHLGDVVSTLSAAADGRWHVGTRAGLQFRCRSVLLAAGVGAFLPRPLKVDGIEAFDGAGLAYREPPAEALAGQRVVVAGATEAALRFASALAFQRAGGAALAPAAVTLVHRREAFEASDETVANFHALRAQGALAFVAGLPAGFATVAGRLSALEVLAADGSTVTLPLDHLVALQGLSPRLGPLADWGLALARRQVAVDTASFATSLPGVFAVGDVISYPGKQRLILSAFHEATLAAAGIAAHLFPGPQPPLEYTTSSVRLHRLLGV